MAEIVSCPRASSSPKERRAVVPRTASATGETQRMADGLLEAPCLLFEGKNSYDPPVNDIKGYRYSVHAGLLRPRPWC